ncbi:MAG: hypothetical protein KBD26_04165 [Candidatus Pacebacteria bacterium]|nr:hypothetical protein [Candidatus Paceibacterota bacterium]
MKTNQGGYIGIIAVGIVTIIAVLGGGFYLLGNPSVSTKKDISKNAEIGSGNEAEGELPQVIHQYAVTESGQSNSGTSKSPSLNAVKVAPQASVAVAIKSPSRIVYNKITQYGQTDFTEYKMGIKINNSANIPEIKSGEIFTISWSAPWAENCWAPENLGISLTNSKKYSNSGSIKLKAVYQADVYTDRVDTRAEIERRLPMRITMGCDNSSKMISSSATIELSVLPPDTIPAFTFLNPKQGDVLNKYNPAYNIRWKIPSDTAKIAFTLYNAKDNTIVSPDKSDLDGGGYAHNMSGYGFQEWLPNRLPNGEYYLAVSSINDVAVKGIKSGTFKISKGLADEYSPNYQVLKLIKAVKSYATEIYQQKLYKSLGLKDVIYTTTFSQMCGSNSAEMAEVLSIMTDIRKKQNPLIVDARPAGVVCNANQNGYALSVKMDDDVSFKNDTWCIDYLGYAEKGVIKNNSITCSAY